MINCVRHLGITDINQIDRMTLYEYDLLITGHNLCEVDEMRKLHMQAFLNRQIEATKDKKGTPLYRSFDDFFNYKKELDRITNESKVDRDQTAFDLMFKANTS